MNAWPSDVRTQVEVAVERPGDAAVLQLDHARFEQLRAEDKQSFELTLPRPTDRDGVAPEWLTFELERFFVHPDVVTVGLTSERGFEEQAYVPQLQTFTLSMQRQGRERWCSCTTTCSAASITTGSNLT